MKKISALLLTILLLVVMIIPAQALTSLNDHATARISKAYAVYSGPGEHYYRANNGKALVNTSGAVYALGYDNGWMLMLYEANHANQFRVGYIKCASIKGTLPTLNQLNWDWTRATVQATVNLTDDPALTGNPLTTLRGGDTVSYLTTMFNNTGWDYVETTINGQTARGFIPSGYLDIPTENDVLDDIVSKDEADG